MKVLDLFSGLRGWSQPWADAGLTWTDTKAQGIIQGPHERTKLPPHRSRTQIDLDLGDTK